MNRLLMVIIIFSLLLPVAFTVHSEEDKTKGALLESISYEKDNENSEKIIFKLNGTHIPKIFKIKGEKPRLVFDFIDTRYSELINNIINTEGGLIQGVRVGIHNDPPKTRVVVDLKPEGKFQFEQDFLIQDNILSITFHPDDQRQEGEGVKEKTVKKSPVLKPVADKKNIDNKQVAAKLGQSKGSPSAVKKPIEVPDKSNTESVEKIPAVVKADQTSFEKKPKVTADSTKEGRVNPILEQMTEEKQPLEDPILREVSFESTANDSEMVLFKLNDFYPPIVFGIEKGNPRVVCDFLDTDLAESVRSVIQTKGMYVSRVRTALHENPHKVRVVLDLIPNRNYDLQQVFFKEDNLFVIIINEFEEEPVQAPELPATSAQ